jgi:hypothetical protein
MQELSDKENEDPENNKRGQANDRAITAIENCIEALEELNNQE